MNHDVSCRIVIPIIKYVNSHGYNVDHLISGLFEKHYIENPKNWVSRELVLEPNVISLPFILDFR